MSKKYISILFLLFIILLFLFAKNSISATSSGIMLWAKNVVPSLFPFFIAVNLLSYSSVPYYLSKFSNKFVRKLFNLSGIAAYPFIMGIISGSPIGAKITCKLYQEKIISKNEAEKILCFTNNSSPLFIIGTVGISFYSNTSIGICMLICHVLSAIIVGIFVGNFSFSYLENITSKKSSMLKNLKHKNLHTINNNINSNINNNMNMNTNINMNMNININSNINNKINNTAYLQKLNQDITASSLGKVLSLSVVDAIKSIFIVGGFVTLFSIIISLLQVTKILPLISFCFCKIFGIKQELINGFLCGILEFTNGLSAISKVPLKAISFKLMLSSFLLGFGGLSVFFQVASIASKANLSTKKYFRAKIFQGIIASILTYLIFQIPILNFNL